MIERMNDFSEQEKIAAFDKIVEKYFYQNFGTMSKADFETLLFSIYIEHCLDNHLPYDDYTLSRQFGISQNRIRTFKQNKELKYPRGEKFNWKDAFAEEIKYARYDDTKKLIKMNVSDVNVLIELRHFMEENGWYDEYQLNPKLFQCRADIFVTLCQKLDGRSIELNKEMEKKIKQIEEICKPEEQPYIKKILSGSLEDGLKGLALSASKEIFVEVVKLLPFGGIAAKAFEFLERVVANS